MKETYEQVIFSKDKLKIMDTELYYVANTLLKKFQLKWQDNNFQRILKKKNWIIVGGQILS